MQCYDWWKKIFDQAIKSSIRTYDKIRKFAASEGDEYTSSYLLDYNYFNKNYKLIAIDLSKQQTLDADLGVIHWTLTPFQLEKFQLKVSKHMHYI